MQEVGGSFPEHIEKSAEMLAPDIAVVTNIGYAHLDLYKEFENLKKDKLSLLEKRSKTGVAIINYDNDYLREWAKTAEGEIITFSLYNKNADYYAENVMQTLDGLRLIVTEKKSQRSTRLKIDIVGEHNAYNVLAAFAVGRKLNLEEEKIAKCIAKFETKGIRQKMYNIGGYHIYVDCFSSVEDSLVLSIQTLSKIPVGVGNKRIAVIWELMRLGNNGEPVYKRIVDKIKDLDIDYIFLFGNGARTMAEDLQKYRNNVYFTSNYYEMVRWIDIVKRPGDVLLFKGQHMQSTTLAIDNVFGTECVVNSVQERKNNGTLFAKDIWYGVKLHGSAIVIDRQKCTEESVNIPNSIDKIPVICLNKNLFENSDIISVNMGNNIVSILDKAFLRCNKLTNVKISTNIKTIGKEAFKLCKSIKKITIPKGCIVIGEKAFEGCGKLEEICISDTVEKIGNEAFSGCDSLTIYAPTGSYAQKYAEKNNIKFIGSDNK